MNNHYRYLLIHLFIQTVMVGVLVVEEVEITVKVYLQTDLSDQLACWK